MKSTQILLLVMVSLFSLSTFAQSYEADAMDPEMDDQMHSPEDADEEIVPPVSDVVSAPGEIERQEDILNPEGEEGWNIGGEDLPSEEYE